MTADSSAIIVPGHGTMFWAASSAIFPETPLTAFKLNTAPPTGWACLGHTSKENTVAFSKEGGDKTQLDTWYSDAVRVVYGPMSWGATVGALQIDKQTLDMAFGGVMDTVAGKYSVPASTVPLTGQAVILFQDTTDSMLFHMPNTQSALGEAPSVNVEGFFEVQLALAILAADSLLVNGKPGLMSIWKNSFKATP